MGAMLSCRSDYLASTQTTTSAGSGTTPPLNRRFNRTRQSTAELYAVGGRLPLCRNAVMTPI